jgi:hypothetical protein
MTNPFSTWSQADVDAHNARCRSEGDHELARAALPERRLHDQIIDYCARQWPPWPCIHARMDRRSTIAIGCHDFTIFAPGRVICIECKRVGGKMTTEQIGWAFQMQKVGFIVQIVHTFDEFLTIVKVKGGASD